MRSAGGSCLDCNLLPATLLPCSYQNPPLKPLSPIPLHAAWSAPSPGQLSAALLLGEQEVEPPYTPPRPPPWLGRTGCFKARVRAGCGAKTCVRITGASYPQRVAHYGGYPHARAGQAEGRRPCPKCLWVKRGLFLTVLCPRPRAPASARRLAAVLLCRNCSWGGSVPGWPSCSLPGGFSLQEFLLDYM